jgi:hypothetical protein
MLGCRWSFFVEHMAEQFGPEMSWQTYGKTWQIHHLRAFTTFDFKRRRWDILLVHHWLNLHPMSPAENVARADTIHVDGVRQLERNLEKARRLRMTGRIRKTRPTIYWWQTWLRLLNEQRCEQPF